VAASFIFAYIIRIKSCWEQKLMT